MNLNLFLYLLLLLNITSCKPSKKEMLEEFKKAYDKYTDDLTFKNNLDVTYIERTPISYETVSNAFLDTLKSNNFTERAINFQSTIKRKIVEQDMFKDIFSSSSSNSDNHEDLIKPYKDSINYYLSLDSILKTHPTKANGSDYYKVKYFIKATLSMELIDKQEKTNFIDTIYILFDKDYKVLGEMKR